MQNAGCEQPVNVGSTSWLKRTHAVFAFCISNFALPPSMSMPRRRLEQMVERARVVAQHVAVAHTQSPILGDDDPARFEWFDRVVDGLWAAGDAEVGPTRRQRLEQHRRPFLELTAGDRG